MDWGRFMEDFILSAQVIDGFLRVRTLRVHDRAACTGRRFACVIHSPSDHHMKSWPLNWRMDTGVMERMCPHGVGHPDPDHITWVVHCDPAMTWHGTHGCDSCCIPSMNWEDTAW